MTKPDNRKKYVASTAGIANKLAGWYAGKGPVLRFTLGFAVLMAVFYGLALTPFCDAVLFPAYLHANAVASNGVLLLLGQNSQVSGITIRSAQFAVTIQRGCDAIEPSWFFCAAVLSFPSHLSAKLVGILVGTISLQILNIFRIASLYLIGLHAPRFFATVHLEVWPVVFILAALLLWVTWISRARKWETARSDAVA